MSKTEENLLEAESHLSATVHHKHTTTPYEIITQYSGEIAIFQGDEFIVQVESMDSLVRSCNAHADLVTALEAFLDGWQKCDGHSETIERLCHAEKLAVAALDKAKGDK